MICRTTTKDYHDLFLDLMSQLKKNNPAQVSQVMVECFASQTASSRNWPSDPQIQEAFRTLPLNRLYTRGRVRLIHEAMKDLLRSPKSVEMHVQRRVLAVEHIMPVCWQDH